MALNRMKPRLPAAGRGRPSFWRPSRALPGREGAQPRGNTSRPRPVGGVNELVKYADIDARGHANGGAGLSVLAAAGIECDCGGLAKTLKRKILTTAKPWAGRTRRTPTRTRNITGLASTGFVGTESGRE